MPERAWADRHHKNSKESAMTIAITLGVSLAHDKLG
jgi:hypothetical protein